MPLSQTIQFNGVSAQALYRAYLSSAQHAAMTVDGTYATTYRRRGNDVDTGDVGDELWAIGPTLDDGNVQYSVSARVLELVPDRLIVLSWKNKHEFWRVENGRLAEQWSVADGAGAGHCDGRGDRY